MPRALDHLVLGTANLDRVGERFAALGFTVGSRNVHPWGTHNRIVQFGDETFLELITVGDATRIPEHAARHFSFGAHVRDGIATRPGLSMLVLKGSDARRDAAEFKAAGLGDFIPFDFERKGKGPDGSDVHVAFSLAFARDEAALELGLFTCQQHFPENFWSKAAQTHDNGARGIARVTIAAENPADHHIPLAAFVGIREMRATSAGIEIAAGEGIIEVVTDMGFQFHYGAELPTHETPVFGGITLRVADIGMIASAAKRIGLPSVAIGEALVLTPTPDFMTALRFEPTGGKR